MTRTPAVIRAHGLGYRHPGASRAALRGVDLEVQSGELVVLTGPTGSGKSTLLRLLAGLLQRHGAGEVTGEVWVDGVDPARTSPRERVGRLGFVGQEPSDQLIAGSLAEEVAFAMESAGLSAETMARRVPELLREVGLPLDLDRDPRTLSGGQAQRLVVAAALSAGAPVLLLDEPLAMLDPVGADELLTTLRRLADRGAAVVMVEHRLAACWSVADRVVVLDEGRLVDQARRAEVGPGHRLVATLGSLGIRATIAGPGRVEEAWAPGPPLLSFTDLSWRYPGSSLHALAPLSLELRAGERLAVAGENGSGKSTLLRLIAERGGADTVAVPQDPDLSLFCESVRAELEYGPRERRLPALDAGVARVARALSIEDLLDRPPQALSRGQRLRVAVAAALSCRPRVLLLDEPTAGQDHEQVEAMMTALRGELADGALVFATHDLDLARRHGNQALRLHQGRAAGRGHPADVLDGRDRGSR